MLLLGDIRQIQKLIKTAHHGNQRVVREVLQQCEQLIALLNIPQAGFFGLFADLLNLLQNRIATLFCDGFTQQAAQHPHFIAQYRVQFEGFRLTHNNAPHCFSDRFSVEKNRGGAS